MKTKINLIIILSFLIVTGVFAKKEKVTFKVEMDCISCKQKIEKNIAFEKGVKDMDVSFKEKTVTITYDDSKTNVERLQKGFEKIGYKAEIQKTLACCSGCTADVCSVKCDSSSETKCKSTDCVSNKN